MSIEAYEPLANAPLEGPQLEVVPTREQHIANLEQIRDGASAESPLAQALQVGKSAMYLLDSTTGSSEYAISPEVARPDARPVIHDPREPSYAALYAFRQPEVPYISLITSTRRGGKTLGTPTVVILPREGNWVENTRALTATEDNYRRNVSAHDAPEPGRKSYGDFVAYAAGVLAEVLSTPNEWNIRGKSGILSAI